MAFCKELLEPQEKADLSKKAKPLLQVAWPPGEFEKRRRRYWEFELDGHIAGIFKYLRVLTVLAALIIALMTKSWWWK